MCVFVSMYVNAITSRVFIYNRLLLQDHNVYPKTVSPQHTLTYTHTHNAKTYKRHIIQAFLS